MSYRAFAKVGNYFHIICPGRLQRGHNPADALRTALDNGDIPTDHDTCPVIVGSMIAMQGVGDLRAMDIQLFEIVQLSPARIRKL